MNKILLVVVTLVLSGCAYMQAAVDIDKTARREEAKALKMGLCSLPWWVIQEDPCLPPIIKLACAANAQISPVDLLESVKK
jgi:hypothetical protein